MKSILLIGLNRFGSLLAKQLYDLGHQIMAVDKNEDRTAGFRSGLVQQGNK